ncbi:hypothetical protein [Pleionea sediminis]|uniref:hypothetical protein n=1 Tax=Pleionea sediminis TaxID=2569479 RepID=UPI0011853CD6|nr:hypothetical protein [Pleionea sediminis]
MKIIFLAKLLFWSLFSNASQPHYYSFDKVLLSEGEITIEAKTKDHGKKLELLSINTPDGKITLNVETTEKILNPKLNTIGMALMPYELEDGVRYLNEISMSFYGDRICKSDTNSLSGNWAPESKLIIVFWDLEHTIRIESGKCDA